MVPLLPFAFRKGNWIVEGGSTTKVMGGRIFSHYPVLTVWLERQLLHENTACLPGAVANTMKHMMCELHNVSQAVGGQ